MDSLHIPAIIALRQQRLKDAMRRDLLFLLGGMIAFFIVGYVEMNAADDNIRTPLPILTRSNKVYIEGGNDCSIATTPEILDAGFILTSPLHSYLARHRNINDALALWNSVLLVLPLAYIAWVTLWRGDFRLSFRLIATHLFRSLCGWFTYLPPDQGFLASCYDFPEIFFSLLLQECSTDGPVNFVTFFSGHVATIVIVGNHLYMVGHTHLSICLHCFNWLQAIRLLATRGHYSIDLIIGYVVAAFVSGKWERFGLYYSQGIQPEVPTMLEVFETLVGVSVAELSTNNIKVNTQQCESEKHERNAKLLTQTTSLQADDVRSETSVRIVVDIMTNIAQLKRG